MALPAGSIRPHPIGIAPPGLQPRRGRPLPDGTDDRQVPRKLEGRRELTALEHDHPKTKALVRGVLNRLGKTQEGSSGVPVRCTQEAICPGAGSA